MGDIVVSGTRNPRETDEPGGGGFIGGGGSGGGGSSGGGRGGGGGGGRGERPKQPEPVRVDEKPKPSEGQEDFADDGDPFNDGEAPTSDTVKAWLNSLFENATNPGDGFIFVQDNTDGPTTYEGYYVLDGLRTSFSSDGNGNYGQGESVPVGRSTNGLVTNPHADLTDDFFF